MHTIIHAVVAVEYVASSILHTITRARSRMKQQNSDDEHTTIITATLRRALCGFGFCDDNKRQPGQQQRRTVRIMQTAVKQKIEMVKIEILTVSS